MKALIFASLIVLSTSASAVEIAASASADINISRVERAITLSNDNGRIGLVEVDNGGSTDISAAVAPSQLLLTYFADGEMNNVFATFDLGGIATLVKAKLKGTIVIADVVVRTEEMKDVKKTISVDVSKLVRDAKVPVITVEEFEDQLLETSVTVK